MRLEDAPAVVLDWKGGEEGKRKRRAGGRLGGYARGEECARFTAASAASLISPPVADSADLTYLDSSSRLPAPPETIVVMYLGFEYVLPSADAAAVSMSPVMGSYG